MSRKDPRKGVKVRLPDAQRVRLVQSSNDWRPLPALIRKAVMAGLEVQDNGRHETSGHVFEHGEAVLSHCNWPRANGGNWMSMPMVRGWMWNKRYLL